MQAGRRILRGGTCWCPPPSTTSPLPSTPPSAGRTAPLHHCTVLSLCRNDSCVYQKEGTGDQYCFQPQDPDTTLGWSQCDATYSTTTPTTTTTQPGSTTVTTTTATQIPTTSVSVQSPVVLTTITTSTTITTTTSTMTSKTIFVMTDEF